MSEEIKVLVLTESLLQSVIADIITFSCLTFCIWFSGDSKFWSFITFCMFGSFIIRVAFKKAKEGICRSPEQLKEYAETLIKEKGETKWKN